MSTLHSHDSTTRPESSPERIAEKARALIGKPYRLGGRGPDAYDCWGLVRALRPDVPDFTSSSPEIAEIVSAFMEGNRSVWQRPDRPPRNGDILGMSKSRVLHHAGIWVEGYAIHADAPAVQATLIRNLQVYGWRRVEVFEWHG